ncbi:MAG TPA: TonB family protein, partial [Verrucomicrobiota bacterium]|nr:TonB family protein [Verrucomicrobiota bacterium]
PQQPQPQPQPVVQPPPPRSQPQPARVEKVETPKPLPTVKNDPDPVPAKPEPPKRQLPKVSTDLVTRKDVAPVRQTTRTQPAPQPDASKDFTKAAQAIRNRASSSTEIEMPQGGGGSGPAYANYAQLVKSRYTMAWNPPDGIEDEDATVKVSVTIARDGTVISARVTQSSGNAAVDRSVRATLDRVTFIAPFPEGSKDTQRSYIINFNLKAKLQLG